MAPEPECSIEKPCNVWGRVTSLALSGRSRNSGGFQLTISPKKGDPVNLVASTLASGGDTIGLEQGVFAGFVAIASTAIVSDLTLRANYYWMMSSNGGQNRLVGLSFEQEPTAD